MVMAGTASPQPRNSLHRLQGSLAFHRWRNSAQDRAENGASRSKDRRELNER
jgi:hypothetical protein